jgi:hypothetical protein
MGRPGAAPKRRTRVPRAARQQAREQRVAAGIPGAPPKPVKVADRANASYWGLAGGLWVTISFVLTAALTAASDHEQRAILAILYLVLAVAFVPAIVFSIIESQRRDVVLRVETGLCLVLALSAIFIPPLDPGISLLLSPGTFLLATGAGIVFGANRPKKERG